MRDGVRERRQEGIAADETLDPIAVEIDDFLIGDDPIPIDVRIEDRPVESVELEARGSQTKRTTAIVVASTQREAVACGYPGPFLAVVGVADASGQTDTGLSP